MLMISKKILVAIDGSPQSDKAAEEAVRLVLQMGKALWDMKPALQRRAPCQEVVFEDDDVDEAWFGALADEPRAGEVRDEVGGVPLRQLVAAAGREDPEEELRARLDRLVRG